jgi:hypothetical protein
MTTMAAPLSNVQLELLKLFSTNVNTEELIELKTVLANFYAEKAILKSNQIWDEKEFSDELMDNWLNKENQ